MQGGYKADIQLFPILHTYLLVGMASKQHNKIDSLGSRHFLLWHFRSATAIILPWCWNFPCFPFFNCTAGLRMNVSMGAFFDNSLSTFPHSKSTSPFAFGRLCNSGGLGLKLIHTSLPSAWMVFSSSAKVGSFSHGCCRKFVQHMGIFSIKCSLQAFLQVQGMQTFWRTLPPFVPKICRRKYVKAGRTVSAWVLLNALALLASITVWSNYLKQ